MEELRQLVLKFGEIPSDIKASRKKEQEDNDESLDENVSSSEDDQEEVRFKIFFLFNYFLNI